MCEIVAHVDNLAISRERFGLFAENYSFTYNFHVFSLNENHQIINFMHGSNFYETSTKCEHLQKFRQPQISTNYWVYTFFHKIK